MLAVAFLDVATEGAFALLLLAVLGAFARVVRGPSLADRVIALDLLSVTLVAFAAVYAVRSGEVAFLDPPLTTVAQAKYTLGQKAMEMALALLQGQEVVPDVLLQPALVLRSSCASPGV